MLRPKAANEAGFGPQLAGPAGFGFGGAASLLLIFLAEQAGPVATVQGLQSKSWQSYVPKTSHVLGRACHAVLAHQGGLPCIDPQIMPAA